MKQKHIDALWDVFDEQYTLEQDPYAPPERYIPIYKCEKGYEEVWSVEDPLGKEHRITIEYSVLDYRDLGRHTEIYRGKTVDKGYRPKKLIMFGVNAEELDKALDIPKGKDGEQE